MQDYKGPYKTDSPVSPFKTRDELEGSPKKFLENLMNSIQSKIETCETSLSLTWSANTEKLNAAEKRVNFIEELIRTVQTDKNKWSHQVEVITKEKISVSDQLSASNLR